MIDLTDPTLAARFAAKVYPEPNSGCWLWDGACDDKGYGQIRNVASLQRAHRVSYELHVGPIAEGLFACHRCDVPACVNPDHLFAGTARDNSRDMLAKGRHFAPCVRGERNGMNSKPESRPCGGRNGMNTKPERRPRGEAHGRSVGPDATVARVRELYLSGRHSYASLAKMFGVSKPTVATWITGTRRKS